MINSYYTKVQVDEQATIIGQHLKYIKTNLKEYVDASALTPAEREKLEGLEGSKFLGTFLSAELIPRENAVAGSYADVDAGSEEFVQRWIYDVDSGVFVRIASVNGGGDTATTIKAKYESNSDTNAFTDSHKTLLESLASLTPTTDITSFLEAFNAAIAGVPIGTVLVNLSSLANVDVAQNEYGVWESNFYSNDVNWEASPGDPDYVDEIYSNQILLEINFSYPTLNILRSEVSIVPVGGGNYKVTSNSNRVSGLLKFKFLPPT